MDAERANRDYIEINKEISDVMERSEKVFKMRFDKYKLYFKNKL